LHQKTIWTSKKKKKIRLTVTNMITDEITSFPRQWAGDHHGGASRYDLDRNAELIEENG
jgi:hypothetical protein